MTHLFTTKYIVILCSYMRNCHKFILILFYLKKWGKWLKKIKLFRIYHLVRCLWKGYDKLHYLNPFPRILNHFIFFILFFLQNNHDFGTIFEMKILISPQIFDQFIHFFHWKLVQVHVLIISIKYINCCHNAPIT